MTHIESIANDLLDTVNPFVTEYFDSASGKMKEEFNAAVKEQITKALMAGIEIGYHLTEHYHKMTADKWLSTGEIDYSL